MSFVQINLNVQSPSWINFWDTDQELIICLNKVCLTVLNQVEWPFKTEIDITLTDNKDIQEKNRKFRNKDMPTNVLSFPQFDFESPSCLIQTDFLFCKSIKVVPLGDLVLGFEKVLEEAEKEGVALSSHTLRLIIHGMLHLLGFDHVKSADARVMHNFENTIFIKLNLPPFKI